MIFSSTRILSALLYFLALLSLGAAQLAVSNVTVRQRLPRDGKVEITYTLGAVKDVNDTSLTAAVTFTGTDNVTGRTVDVKTLSGAGADGTAVTGSTHTVVWDMAADCPADFHSGSFTVTVAAEVKMPGRYLVVDTEDGTYRLTDQEPDVSDDLCRTRELWLRAIPAGTFTMGSPAGELGRYSGTDSEYNETQHTVKLSNMFFMGIFEVTQGQYGNIGYQNGYPEPHAGAGRPKSGISYHEIRGSVKQWPRNNHTIDLGEDETNEPVIAATVQLLSMPDS
ncbi:MAG: SUMF1/EgtB/PvdO family nonheme iron enzyme, partial [Victivallales bacterium]|nr:SUMF1/EgtB/PvdO family nonheme iron enzyme [Victivallales bacterium]